MRDLIAWVHGEKLVDGHPFGAVQALPRTETAPEVWILGSSDYGAQVAAIFGVPYCFAWFFSDGRGGKQAIDLYKKNYRPSVHHPQPIAGYCVAAFAADSEEKAQHHATSRFINRIRRDRGDLAELLSPEEAMKVPLASHEQARLERMRQESFVGVPSKVAQQIRDLAERDGIDEMAIVTWTWDEEVRRDSYTLLAKEFGLTPG